MVEMEMEMVGELKMEMEMVLIFVLINMMFLCLRFCLFENFLCGIDSARRAESKNITFDVL